MRFVVYVAAVLIAAGTVYILGKQPSGNTDQPTTASASASTDAPKADAEVGGNVNTEITKVALDVPGMHCAFGCFPTVKETLESVDGVQTVELAKQNSETELTDKTVFVTCNQAFNLDSALEKLKTAGFEATEIASTGQSTDQ